MIPALEEHRIPTADGISLILHRVMTPPGEKRTPVLLIPGTFSSHRFWVGDRGQGFGPGLVAEGFDPWMLDLRGHGSSDRPPRWTMEEWIQHDATAAMETVARVTGSRRIFLLGHSAGGVVAAAFAGSGHPAADLLGGLVLLGAPGPVLRLGRRAGATLLLSVTTLLPFWSMPGRLVGLGPEHEPAVLVRDWMKWNLSGRWSRPDGEDYLERMGRIDLPVLAVAGAGDRLLSPPAAVQDFANRFGSRDRTLITAGIENGYSVDYDHPGLVIGGNARREIWPHIFAWLKDHDIQTNSTTSPVNE